MLVATCVGFAWLESFKINWWIVKSIQNLDFSITGVVWDQDRLSMAIWSGRQKLPAMEKINMGKKIQTKNNQQISPVMVSGVRDSRGLNPSSWRTSGEGRRKRTRFAANTYKSILINISTFSCQNAINYRIQRSIEDDKDLFQPLIFFFSHRIILSARSKGATCNGLCSEKSEKENHF